MEKKTTHTKAAPYHITTFYKFVPFAEENLETIRTDLLNFCQNLQIRGLFILGHEGLNSTVCGSEENLAKLKDYIRQLVQDPGLHFKDSLSDFNPFHRLICKIREEIVTLNTPDLKPDNEKNFHLTPEQWNDVLKNEEDFLLFDTRNNYETKLGKFKNAIDPDIEAFTDFPKFIDEQNIPKDKKILMYCTGGIRCEKGLLELKQKGFENVYQLDGGILNYIEQYPNDQFEGECYVFDHRVSVDQELKPSEKFFLCPHCGDPAEKKINCVRCDSEAHICESCLEKEYKAETCSKNCAYHYQLHPERKGKKQPSFWDAEHKKT